MTTVFDALYSLRSHYTAALALLLYKASPFVQEFTVMADLKPVTLNAAIEQLVPVYEGEIGGHPCYVVHARELYTFLGVRQQFAAWIRERIDQYGFLEGRDFESFFAEAKKPNPQGGRPRIEYILTLGMAKELAMVERTERGHQVRQYFLDLEQRVFEQLLSARSQLTPREKQIVKEAVERKVSMVAAHELRQQAFKELWGRIYSEFGVDKYENLRSDQLGEVLDYITYVILRNSDPAFKKLLEDIFAVMVRGETIDAMHAVRERLRHDITDLFMSMLNVSKVNAIKDALLEFQAEHLDIKH